MGVVAVDVKDVPPDVRSVGALARLQLLARRHGGELRLRNASAELLELIHFVGLHDVLPLEPARRET
jgi:hypothetical protein